MLELVDIPRVFLIFFLETVLSLDNVIAISLIVRHLRKDQQKKALWIGFSSALILRGVATLTLAYFIHFKWIEFIGACYLIYLSFSFKKHPKPGKARSFFQTLVLIELTDLALALDSIIAAIGIVGIPPKLWIVYLGGAFGMLTMRFAAQGFLNLSDKFPKLDRSAQGIVFLVGLKLLLEVFNLYPPSGDFVFWGLSALFLALGIIKSRF